jgi:hypothetical protein
MNYFFRSLVKPQFPAYKAINLLEIRNSFPLLYLRIYKFNLMLKESCLWFGSQIPATGMTIFSFNN